MAVAKAPFMALAKGCSFCEAPCEADCDECGMQVCRRHHFWCIMCNNVHACQSCNDEGLLVVRHVPKVWLCLPCQTSPEELVASVIRDILSGRAQKNISRQRAEAMSLVLLGAGADNKKNRDMMTLDLLRVRDRANMCRNCSIIYIGHVPPEPLREPDIQALRYGQPYASYFVF